jgi:hypothetical protein
MNFTNKRIKKLSKTDIILNKIKKYAYLETVTLTGLFLLIGYIFHPQDVCFVQTQVSYALILLAILTLFHGFENGLIAIGMLSAAMWFFYPEFPYTDFLALLMMTMIFSEFHYYWTKKIKELQVEANYKTTKLNELSKAFYTLKVSHDQLEKNYVVKPMSIRSAVENIIASTQESKKETTDEKISEFYQKFLFLLEKSFNVHSALIIHKNQGHQSQELTADNATVTYSLLCEKYSPQEISTSYLFRRAVHFQQPVYISDQEGEPTLHSQEESKFLVAIPFVSDTRVASVLLIERMPFMAFNKENLTSISILLEYLSIAILQNDLYQESYAISGIDDKQFLYEYTRLRYIYDKYSVSSSIMVLKFESELQSRKVYEKLTQMLRSLDLATAVKHGKYYFIVLLFPLSDTSSALGFLKRLQHNIKYDKDKAFETMHFSVKQLQLLNKYIEDNYDE